MKVIGWKVWADDGQVYSSKEYPWEKVPGDGLLGMVVYFDEKAPDGNPLRRVAYGGNCDYYFRAPGPVGPIYGHSNDDPETITTRYPGASVKRGKWTDEATMYAAADAMAAAVDF
jgi:hypothetical protein